MQELSFYFDRPIFADDGKLAIQKGFDRRQIRKEYVFFAIKLRSVCDYFYVLEGDCVLDVLGEILKI